MGFMLLHGKPRHWWYAALIQEENGVSSGLVFSTFKLLCFPSGIWIGVLSESALCKTQSCKGGVARRTLLLTSAAC